MAIGTLIRSRLLPTFITMIACIHCVNVNGQEIGYIEDFSLAKDRDQALKQLIPGTDDSYYYTCLHLQNLGQYDRVEKLLGDWIKRHNVNARVREIQHRQALLTYDQNPQKSLAYLRQQLSLQFNHQRDTVDRAAQLATQLDPQLIARKGLADAALKRHRNNLNGFEDRALDWVATTTLDAARRRDLLKRLQKPDVERLPQLVVADLGSRNSRGFGSFAIHRNLLKSQLDECLELMPPLRNQTNFVNVYLSKLQPSPDVNIEFDRNARAAFLNRMWDFVQTLAPSHNSLKAHVLYHQLALDEVQGRYDRDKFLTYIKLPRPVDYVNRKYLEQPENQRFRVNMGADFRAFTRCRPIGNDRALVRRYLQHFFVDAGDFRTYLPYLNDVFLKHLFAETKIVNGIGDPEQWYSMLPPDVYQRLKERVDLDFALTNPRHVAANDDVSIDVDIKNVPNLIVKVYRINALNYYQDQSRDVDTAINLDGLIPNEELSFQYTEPALRRVRRHFEFESLKKPGLYVVDFIGNGKSSRALIQKGKLRHVVHSTPGGLAIVVFDEQNRLLTDASLWLGGREYSADPTGRILVPFSTQPKNQVVVLTHDATVTLTSLQHLPEAYELKVGFYVDRESLLTGQLAKLLVRPGLFLNHHPISVAALENVQLTIVSQDQEGVSSTDTVTDVKLTDSGDFVHEFRVPPRLASLSVTLSAEVKSFSENTTKSLNASETFGVNAIDATPRIEDLHFSKTADVYVLDMFGKTGETRRNRPVQLQLKHQDFRDVVTVSLRSDDNGRIMLGRLEGIEWFKTRIPDGTERQWNLRSDRFTYYQSVNGLAGDEIALPYVGASDEPDRRELSLFEMRHGQYVADRFSAIGLRDGQLVIRDLKAGDYLLTLKASGRQIRLRLTDGSVAAGFALGAFRQLELRGTDPVSIESVRAQGDDVQILVANPSKHARVHVFATNYQPAFDAFDQIARVKDANPIHGFRLPSSCLYVEGRQIGDEYRYILDRKYAEKYPGNMLARPELLLNPWAIRDTKTEKEELNEDAAFDSEAPAAEAADNRAAARKGQASSLTDPSDLNFLADASVVELNAKPDAEGRISIERDALNGKQTIVVVAVDPLTTAVKSMSLPEIAPKFLDLRLVEGLGADANYSQQKQISLVKSGTDFDVADIRSGRFEFYDGLSRVFQLYQTLSPNPQLEEFRFILRWDRMSDDEKLELYSKYACHELNFFVKNKDPEFFDAVIQPYLSHKLNKTFLDHYLLGNDLGAFLSPWNYNRLNVVERILLARRIAGEQPITADSLKNAADLIPPDIDQFNRFFDTALMGQALSWGGGMGGGGGFAGAAVSGGIATKSRGMMRSRGQALAAGEQAKNWNRLSRRARPAPGQRPSLAAMPKSAAAAADDSVERDFAESVDKFSDASRFAFESVELRQELQSRLYRTLDKTQEWVENNYYKLPIDQQNQALVQVNSFWVEFAKHDDSQPFYSTALAEASRNFTEMMFALSVLDLPFESPEHETNLDGDALTVTVDGPVIVYHQQIQPTTSSDDASPLLVSQNYFQQGDRYRQEGNQRLDKFVTDEFLVQTVYGCQVVVTNPTSAQRRLDVLTQVPEGAIPVNRGRFTRNVNIQLQPYSTHAFEYFFYFPSDGEFEQFPVHVTQGQQLIVAAEPMTFNVVKQLSKIDRQSWDYISQFGTDEQVLEFLESQNLFAVRLDRIAFRMSDLDFFDKAIAILQRRHAYDSVLWSYAIKHNEPSQINEYLQHNDSFVSQCGVVLESPLLTINPVARHAYEHMEYRPLVNARAHQVGKRRQILNDRLHAQYHRWLRLLSYVRDINDQDRLATVYYLLTQDRVSDAISQFEQIDSTRLETRMQYDYCEAYLGLSTGDLGAARSIANRYADYPVERWKNAFALVTNQIDEIEGKAVGLVDDENRDQVQDQLAAADPTFEFNVEAQAIDLSYRNLTEVTVNFYRMDIELLFSRSPFVQKYSGQFSYIEPNLSQRIDLPADQDSVQLDIPEELKNQNVLVEVAAAGQRQSNAYYSNSLSVQVSENFGQLRVLDQATGDPLPTTYVKVYSQNKDGSIAFYKDGYTDLRGRFDYASLSTNALDNVAKFSILVLHDEAGALVREANPPSR